MTFYQDERIGLFIDGANLYAALRGLDMEIDYSKLLREFRNRGRLIRANYYTALLQEHETSPLKPLIDWLSYNGFNVITKPAKEFTDPQTGRKRIKGDMDVDLAIDALLAADWLDHLILFSGDGDFCVLVRALQSKGVRVSVVSTVKSKPPIAAAELRRQADNFIELADLAQMIGRDPL
ncbi:MAG: NYN domain-containing protein [Robiginitomaculum sp.]|nr:MAG: NYN domain-containing protein [Robiginitomaculum sp.]